MRVRAASNSRIGSDDALYTASLNAAAFGASPVARSDHRNMSGSRSGGTEIRGIGTPVLSMRRSYQVST
jgi:hypothetical protein